MLRVNTALQNSLIQYNESRMTQTDQYSVVGIGYMVTMATANIQCRYHRQVEAEQVCESVTMIHEIQSCAHIR